MLRIVLALTACYVAGTDAGRGFLPYRISEPAGNFKSDVDTLAADGMRLTKPETLRNSVTGLALEGTRRTLDGISVRH